MSTMINNICRGYYHTYMYMSELMFTCLCMAIVYCVVCLSLTYMYSVHMIF